MSTRTEEDLKGNSQKEINEYCLWCWHHDFGCCDKCAIEMKQKKAKSDKEASNGKD